MSCTVLYITVDGVPSLGQWLLVGNGKIGAQTTADVVALPDSFIPEDIDKNDGNNNNGKSGAVSLTLRTWTSSAFAVSVAAVLARYLA